MCAVDFARLKVSMMEPTSDIDSLTQGERCFGREAASQTLLSSIDAPRGECRSCSVVHTESTPICCALDCEVYTAAEFYGSKGNAVFEAVPR